MAYIYDYQANPEYGYEDEETRRRREEERRIAQEQGLVAPSPQPSVRTVPPGPADPNQVLTNYIRQNESGSNPNIGYHFASDQQGQRRSTAYGAFGITQPAYKDIQSTDPYFRDRSIESLNLQEQERAQKVYNNVLSRQLRSQGIEPTMSNLAQADFLGAKGLADFQRTGYISPAAARANGGEEKVREILAKRAQFQPAPTSGAANMMPQAPISPEQAQQQVQDAGKFALTGFTGALQGIKVPELQQPVPEPMMQASRSFLESQNDPARLLSIRDDLSQPEWRRRAASEQIYGLINTEENLRKGQQQLQDLSQRMAQNDRTATSQLTKELGNQEGSWLKYALFSLLGAQDLTNQEAARLGIGNKWTQETITMPDGTEVMAEIQRRIDGSIVQGRRIGSDEPIPNEALGLAMAGTLPKGVHVTKVRDIIIPDTGERIQEQTLSNAKVRHLQNGKKYTGDVSGGQDATQWEADQDRKMNAANAFINKTYQAGATAEQRVSAYRQAGVHPRYIEELMGYQPGSLTGRARPPTTSVSETGQVPQVQTGQQRTGADIKPNQVTTQAKEDVYETPTQRVGETAADFAARKKSIESKQKPLISLAEDFVKRQTAIESKLSGLRKAIDAIDSGDHNIGPQIAGKQSLPGVQQALGGLVGTKASENTKLIESYMTEAGLQGIKDSFGPQISNFDVQAKMRAMPVSNRSNPDAVREYLLKTYKEAYDAANLAKENAAKLNLVDPGRVELGTAPAELKKRPPLSSFIRQ